MTTLEAPTYWVHIYMSGPIEPAKQAIRAACLPGGLCVTIESTLFIYAGGEEQGFVIGLVNYPRFPATEAVIIDQARTLMHAVLDATFQHSAMLMTPTRSEWITKRPQ